MLGLFHAGLVYYSRSWLRPRSEDKAHAVDDYGLATFRLSLSWNVVM